MPFHADKPFENGGSGGSADEKSSAVVCKPDVINYIRLKWADTIFGIVFIVVWTVLQLCFKCRELSAIHKIPSSTYIIYHLIAIKNNALTRKEKRYKYMRRRLIEIDLSTYVPLPQQTYSCTFYNLTLYQEIIFWEQSTSRIVLVAICSDPILKALKHIISVT